MTLKTAVFASGRGSNFQVLVEHAAAAFARASGPSRAVGRGSVSEVGAPSVAAGEETSSGDLVSPSAQSWEVVLLVTDREDAYALARARSLGVESAVVPADPDPAVFGDNLLAVLDRAEIEMVLNAGYLKLIPPSVVRRFSGRMLNLHPALLPSFGGKGMYGRRVHEAVLEAGVRLSGVTVHFVNEEYDRGRILAQWPVAVVPGDTPDTLAARIHEIEHRLYPAAADRLARAILEGREPSPIPSSSDPFDLDQHLSSQVEGHSEPQL